MSSVLSVGSSLLGALFGRKLLSATNMRKLGTAARPLGEELETIQIRPKKTNIEVRLPAPAWMPYWRNSKGALTAAWS